MAKCKVEIFVDADPKVINKETHRLDSMTISGPLCNTAVLSK